VVATLAGQRVPEEEAVVLEHRQQEVMAVLENVVSPLMGLHTLL
jgi:hypothetical protein